MTFKRRRHAPRHDARSLFSLSCSWPGLPLQVAPGRQPGLLEHRCPAHSSPRGRAGASPPASFFSQALADAFRTDSLVLPSYVLSLPQQRPNRLGVRRGRIIQASVAGCRPPLTSIAAATATTTTATATRATTTGTAKAATTTTTTSAFLRPGFVHGQAAAIQALAGTCANGRLRPLIGAHFDKTEALRASGFAVGDHLRGDDGTVRGEHLFELALADGVSEVANVKLLAQFECSSVRM